MELSTIISIVTVFVTLILGLISKKIPAIKNELIPLQNLLIGIIAGIIYYIITKDFNAVIIGLGLFAGGTYDLAKNLSEIFNKEGE